MELVFIIGAVQAFFLPLLIFNKKPKSTGDYVLAFWFLLMGLALLEYYLEVQGKASDYPVFLGITTCIAMLLGPVAYIYVLSITRKEQRLNPLHLLHSLPYLVFTVIVFLKLSAYNGASVEEARLIIEDPDTPVFMALGLFRIFLGPIYLIICLMMLKRHSRKIGDEFSYTQNIDLKWLRHVILVMAIIWSTVIVTNVLGNFNEIIPMEWGDHLIYTVITAAVFFGGFHGIKQQVIFSAQPLKQTAPISDKGVNQSNGQYAKSSLKKEESKEQLKKLLAFMDEEKPYLDGKLSLNQVAEKLEISPNHLSQVINENLDRNFFDFVNGYRVDLVKEKLADPANEKFTILAIAYDAGFSSKSSFNEVFKKFTQQTPSQYQKQIKR
ncbi:MAG: helix-turn-helix transcriptional regulator [Roseivirga sp.]|nr:helix-turn-helix transcriptional regulator [Roseivirga sp.]